MAIVEHTSLPRPDAGSIRRYVRPVEPIHFPAFEEMPETNRHLELRTTLYLFLKHELALRATIGSDQFLYYDPTNPRKKLAPDAFVKLGAPHKTFRVWKAWERGAPDFGVEIVSDSDEGEEDWSTKLSRYRAAGVGEVVRFDPDREQPIRVWDHVGGDLVERAPSEDGAHECAALGLWWVAIPHAALGQVLRLARDREGRDLVPTPEEAEQGARRQAEQARDALAAEVAELRRKLEAQSAAKGSPSKKRAPAQKSGRARRA